MLCAWFTANLSKNVCRHQRMKAVNRAVMVSRPAVTESDQRQGSSVCAFRHNPSTAQEKSKLSLALSGKDFGTEQQILPVQVRPSKIRSRGLSFMVVCFVAIDTNVSRPSKSRTESADGHGEGWKSSRIADSENGT